MGETVIEYINNDLVDLFYKEGEINERLAFFCSKHNKELKAEYSMSISQYRWKLIIKVVNK